MQADFHEGVQTHNNAQTNDKRKQVMVQKVGKRNLGQKEISEPVKDHGCQYG